MSQADHRVDHFWNSVETLRPPMIKRRVCTSTGDRSHMSHGQHRPHNGFTRGIHWAELVHSLCCIQALFDLALTYRVAKPAVTGIRTTISRPGPGNGKPFVGRCSSGSPSQPPNGSNCLTNTFGEPKTCFASVLIVLGGHSTRPIRFHLRRWKFRVATFWEEAASTLPHVHVRFVAEYPPHFRVLGMTACEASAGASRGSDAKWAVRLQL